jgi:hypothetical protein
MVVASDEAVKGCRRSDLLIGGGLFKAGSASSIVGIMNDSCIVLVKKNERVYICCLLCIMYSKGRHRYTKT